VAIADLMERSCVLRSQPKEITPAGAFSRQENNFTRKFGPDPSDLPVKPGCYRLLWSPVCP
jgi:putative glutathione S-transferase